VSILLNISCPIFPLKAILSTLASKEYSQSGKTRYLAISSQSFKNEKLLYWRRTAGGCLWPDAHLTTTSRLHRPKRFTLHDLVKYLYETVHRDPMLYNPIGPMDRSKANWLQNVSAAFEHKTALVSSASTRICEASCLNHFSATFSTTDM